MRIAVLCLLLPGLGVLPARASSKPATPAIRSLAVRLVPTSQHPPEAIDIHAISAALRREGIRLAVEEALEVGEIARAAGAIRRMYSERGHQVRVEHATTRVGRGVEVVFSVVELCGCK